MKKMYSHIEKLQGQYINLGAFLFHVKKLKFFPIIPVSQNKQIYLRVSPSKISIAHIFVILYTEL